MALSWFEEHFRKGFKEGYRQGLKEGIRIGERKFTLRQISRRIPVTPEIREKVRKMRSRQLREIQIALLDPSAPLLDLIFAQSVATPEQIMP